MYKIYSRSGCASCQSAKQLLTQRGLDFKYLLLGVDYKLNEFVEISEGQRTFPLITKMVDGVEHCVGTYESLRDSLKEVVLS